MGHEPTEQLILRVEQSDLNQDNKRLRLISTLHGLQQTFYNGKLFKGPLFFYFVIFCSAFFSSLTKYREVVVPR